MEITENGETSYSKKEKELEIASEIVNSFVQEVPLQTEDTSSRMQSTIVHSIDPDSCDFEPLTKSMNGAALTDLSDLQSVDLSMGQRYRNQSYDHKKFSSSSRDAEDGSRHSEQFYDEEDHVHRSSIKQVVLTLINMLPLSTSAWEKVQEFHSQIFASRAHFYEPVKTTDIDKDDINEKSKKSAALLCLIFIAILIISGLVSTIIRHLTGIGPEKKITEASLSLYEHRFSPQGKGLAPPIGTPLLNVFDAYADIDDLPLELMDTALFWHIPRSAGTSIKNIFSSCLGKVVATEVGGSDDHRLDDRIATVKKHNGIFVNVDLYSIEGIQKANNLGLVQSNLAEIGFTPFVHESSILFDRNHRGRLLTMMRDPTERIISLYYYLRLVNQQVKSQSLDDYIETLGDNWMVRAITGSSKGPIDERHLNNAKEVLRRKVLIGLIDEKTESFRRFEEFLGINLLSPHGASCKNSILYFNWHVKNPHPMPDQTDPILSKILTANSLDIQLYQYSKQLFQEQAALFSPSKKQ